MYNQSRAVKVSFFMEWLIGKLMRKRFHILKKKKFNIISCTGTKFYVRDSIDWISLVSGYRIFGSKIIFVETLVSG